MTGTEAMPFDIDPVLERFPGDAALVARLLVENETFRSVCEDYALARAALAQLESVQKTLHATKIADYQSLVADLERELTEAVRNAKQKH